MALLRQGSLAALLLTFLVVAGVTEGYYLPGTFPQAYEVGDKMQGPHPNFPNLFYLLTP
jgi:hypothetical protein